MKENNNVVEYFIKVSSILIQMVVNGETLNDFRITQKVLYSLSKNILDMRSQTQEHDFKGFTRSFEKRLIYCFLNHNNLIELSDPNVLFEVVARKI